MAGTVIVTLLVLGWISGASWVKLIESSPVTLLALSPANRNLLLVTNSLDTWTYYGVGLVRHLLPDPAFYLLGFWYGRKAIAWASEDNPGMEKMFGPDGSALLKPGAQKVLAVAAILAPNNWVSLACGAARIPLPFFLALNLAGTSLRLWVCRWLGGLFEEEIRGFADWVGRYQNPILAASIAVVLVLMWVQGRRAARELSGLAHLGDDDA